MAEIRLVDGRLMFLANKYEGQVLVYPVRQIVAEIAGQRMKIPHRNPWGEGTYFLYDEGVYDIWFVADPEVYIRAHVQMTTSIHSKDSVEILKSTPGLPMDFTDAPLRWDRRDVI